MERTISVVAIIYLIFKKSLIQWMLKYRLFVEVEKFLVKMTQIVVINFEPLDSKGCMNLIKASDACILPIRQSK